MHQRDFLVTLDRGETKELLPDGHPFMIDAAVHSMWSLDDGVGQIRLTVNRRTQFESSVEILFNEASRSGGAKKIEPKALVARGDVIHVSRYDEYRPEAPPGDIGMPHRASVVGPVRIVVSVLLRDDIR